MKIFYTTQFRKDFKRAQKQNKDIGKLKAVIETLSARSNLPERFQDHPLSGKWSGHRDCHIESDWILIYRISSDSLFLERTSSHSELFK